MKMRCKGKKKSKDNLKNQGERADGGHHCEEEDLDFIYYKKD